MRSILITSCLALMALSFNTVSASERFTTSADSSARQASDLFDSVSGTSPISVKATGNTTQSSANSLTDIGQSAGNAMNMLSPELQQTKAQVAALQNQLANAGGGGGIARVTNSKNTVYWNQPYSENGNNYTTYFRKTGVLMTSYDSSNRVLSQTVTSCITEESDGKPFHNTSKGQYPRRYNHNIPVAVAGC